jgi:hypothetical protein
MNRKGGTPILASSLRSVIGISALSFPAGVAVLALSSLYCVLPLLIQKSIPLGHDTGFHIFQSFQFLQGLENGSFYPRWAADANNGYGSPNFIFYAPLTYYLMSFVHLWEPSMIMSMVWVIWAGFFLSGLTMFFATRKMFGNPGSLLSAVVYQMLPFHLIDLYYRGSFAELLSYSVLPLFFYFLMKTSSPEGSRVSMAGLSLSYAGLILTHLATGFVFTVFAGGYLLYELCCPGKGKSVFKTAFSLLVGLGISAVYLGPAVLERKFVHIGVLPKYIYSYAGIFLFDSRAPLHELFFRFLYITVILEAFFFLLILLLPRKLSAMEKRTDSNRFLIFAFIGAFFLTTPLSGPVWRLIPQFPFLQFPWRWIIVMELSLCFLIAGIYSLEKVQDFRPAIFLKTFILVLVVSLAQLPMQNIHDASISEADFLRLNRMNQWRNIMDEKPEYLPVWANLENIWTRNRDDRVVTISGRASTRVTEWAPESRTIEVRALSDTVIRISSFYYPGWEVTLDGGEKPIDVEKETGALLVHVSEGDHTIRTTFGDTRLRRIAKYASLMSLLFLIPVTMLFGGSIGSKGRSPSK